MNAEVMRVLPATGSDQIPMPASIAPIGIDTSKPHPQAGSRNAPPGPASAAAAWRQVLIEELDVGLSAQRIYQDLVSDHGYAGSYYSVRRLIKKLAGATPMPHRRMTGASTAPRVSR